MSLWRDDAIVATQVHECKEAEQAVVVGVEIAVFEWHVLVRQVAHALLTRPPLRLNKI